MSRILRKALMSLNLQPSVTATVPLHSSRLRQKLGLSVHPHRRKIHLGATANLMPPAPVQPRGQSWSKKLAS